MSTEDRVPITTDNIRRAEEVILDSKASHEAWIDFQRDNPTWEDQTPPSSVGDTKHHAKCVEEYQYVLGLLAEVRERLGDGYLPAAVAP